MKVQEQCSWYAGARWTRIRDLVIIRWYGDWQQECENATCDAREYYKASLLCFRASPTDQNGQANLKCKSPCIQAGDRNLCFPKRNMCPCYEGGR